MFKLDEHSLARLLALLRNDRDSRYVLNKLRYWERCDDCCQTRGMYFPRKSFEASTDSGLLCCQYYCRYSRSYSRINGGRNEFKVTHFHLKARCRRLRDGF